MTEQETFVEQIDVEYPKRTPAEVKFTITVPGEVKVAPAPGAEKLVAGTLECNAEQWRPEVRVRDHKVRFTQPANWRYDKVLRRNRVNRWDLKFGDKKPFELEIEGGGYKGTWELGGLPITELEAQTGAGSAAISFALPAKKPMRKFELQAGAGKARVDGLLNTGFEKMKVEGGVGALELRFTGEKLQRDAGAKVKTAVGRILIVVKRDVPTLVSVTSRVARVKIDAAFHEERGDSAWEKEYLLADYGHHEGPALEIDVTATFGTVELVTET
jgi:hypothetical protein